MILSKIREHGGTPYFVGGCVRDKLLGVGYKDVDIEVFGLSLDKLISILSEFGEPDLVGKSFGVVKLHGVDYSCPRKDSNFGVSHQDFSVEVVPNISIEEAAGRRDFTINSMSMGDIDDLNTLIDPYAGLDDLEKKILRHTSNAFIEDPLRVLRGMQFCARFELAPTSETVELCRSISDKEPTIARERVLEEFTKWATRSIKPSAGLDFLEQTGWIRHYPALANLVGLPQEPYWHPEGCAWTHTKLVCDAGAEIAIREHLSHDDSFVLLMACLLHDVGKAVTTRKNSEGKIISPGHAERGVDIARDFLDGIMCPHKLRDRILELVLVHMDHIGMLTDRKCRRFIARRLKLNSLEMFGYIVEADHSGRPPLPKGRPVILDEMIARCEREKVHARRVVEGRDLIALGYEPGVKFGEILNKLYILQVENGITDKKTLLEAI